jgi:plastocyanin
MATETVPLERAQWQRRAGRSAFLVLLLTLGTSLLVLAPLSVLRLRQEAAARRAAPAVAVELVADGMRFVPAEIRVPRGAQVQVSLVNRDPSGTPHDFQTFGQRVDGRVVAWPGEQRTVYFWAAERPGRYAFICTLRGHSEAGMAGVIVVE